MVLRNARRPSLLIARRFFHSFPTTIGCRPSGLLSSPAAARVQQQRRSYFFWPSDWSELRYRWKLWWEDASPTKIQIRLQQGYKAERTRLSDRYQTQKVLFKQRYQQLYGNKFRQRYNVETIKMNDRYRKGKFQLTTKYHQRKALLQRRYKLQVDQLQRRVQGAKVDYRAYYSRQRLNLTSAKARMTQKRREFVKRWSARRRDLMEDGKNYVRHYLTSRTFTVTEYCEPNWFDAKDGRPLTSRDPTGRFVNPWLSWSTNGVHSITNILKWRYQRGVRQWKERGLLSFLPKDMTQLLFGSPLLSGASRRSEAIQQITPTTAPHDNAVSPTDIEFTWIGHSTCLVRMGHATILTDPIFSHRCSPFPKLPGVGVARDVPPSMTLQELPSTIDVCLISHDHYDHMDQLTILHLRDKVKHWVLPKGLPHWLETRCSVDPTTMTELEWWQSVHFVRSHEDGTWNVVPGPVQNTNNNNNNNFAQNTMTITCCPAQHWSSRTFFDRCKRLWCGFAVETRTAAATSRTTAQQQQTVAPPVVQKFYFAGDTGMPRNGFPLFHQIGEFCGRGLYHQQPQPAAAVTRSEDQGRTNQETIPPQPIQAQSSLGFHPIDLAAIPIGAYDPSFLMRDAHLNPEEAVECARQLQARKAVAIHWGTFALSEEPMEEPPKKLEEALRLPENKGLDFVHLPVGGSMRLTSEGPTEKAEGLGLNAEEEVADMAM
jgi:N-acyl-phosphatidylethanolamine-hydrolysing phospholipase D